MASNEKEINHRRVSWQAHSRSFDKKSFPTLPLGNLLFQRPAPLFSPGGFFRNPIIGEVLLIMDNLFDHFAKIRHRQPIDGDPHELRRMIAAIPSLATVLSSAITTQGCREESAVGGALTSF